MAAAYRSLLAPSIGPVEITPSAESAYHLVVVRVPDRDRVRAALAEREIETGIHYPMPCHRMRPYRAFARGPLPGAEAAATEVLSLPMFPHMSEDSSGRSAPSTRMWEPMDRRHDDRGGPAEIRASSTTDVVLGYVPAPPTARR